MSMPDVNRSASRTSVLAQPCGFAAQERRLADSNRCFDACTDNTYYPANEDIYDPVTQGSGDFVTRLVAAT